METIILFGPLLAAVIVRLGWPITGTVAAHWTAIAIMSIAATLSWVLMFSFDAVTQPGGFYVQELMTFLQSGDLDTVWAIRIDRLSTLFLVMVTSISALVLIYAIGFLARDTHFKNRERTSARMVVSISMLAFWMLVLVTSDNLIQLLVGWFGISITGAILVGFYHMRPGTTRAAKRVAVVNSISDGALILATGVLFAVSGAAGFDVIFAEAPDWPATRTDAVFLGQDAVELISVLFALAALGKSAQIGLHLWMADAAEAPAPAAALLYAVTLGAAGVYVLCRMSPILEFAPFAKNVLISVGAITAVFGTSVAIAQTHIKRVLAYLVSAQLGVLMVAVGLGLYSAALLMLVTMASATTVMLLGAGVLLQGLNGEGDVRKHGGLKASFPATFWVMVIAAIGMTGIGLPLATSALGFAGFAAKDLIVAGAYAEGHIYIVWMLIAASCLGALAAWRLIALCFLGERRGGKKEVDAVRPSHRLMLLPMSVLTVSVILGGSLFQGSFTGSVDQVGAFFGIPISSEPTLGFAGRPGEGALFIRESNTVLIDALNAPAWPRISVVVAALLGLALAFWMYVLAPDRAKSFADRFPGLVQFFESGWYISALYDHVLVRPVHALGQFFWTRGDAMMLDGASQWLATTLMPLLTRLAGRAQSANLLVYASAMLIGLALMVLFVAFAGA